MFTILRNRFRSLITRKHVTAEVPDDDLEKKWLTPAHQESIVEVTAFRRAFRELSTAHREVLVLVGVHGLSYEQVAEICGCEVGTVKSRVNRARAILKRVLIEGELPVDARKLPVAERTSRVPEAHDLVEDMLLVAGESSRHARARRSVRLQ